MEGWRDFLKKPREKKEPEEEEADAPSSKVAALMKRGALSREEAEEMAKHQVELEENDVSGWTDEHLDGMYERFSNDIQDINDQIAKLWKTVDPSPGLGVPQIPMADFYEQEE
jgi:hypothetical protein